MAELTKIDGDYFWDAEDTEQSESDPDELIQNGLGGGQVMKIERAVSLKPIFGFQVYNEADDQYDIHYYETAEEAEQALATLQKPKETV